MAKVSFIFFFFFFGCNDPEVSSHIKSEHLEPHEINSRQGNCFLFKDSTNQYLIAVLMNFHKSEGRIWYGMCFTDFKDDSLPSKASLNSIKFLGRKVMYHMPGHYRIGFNITWVLDTTVNNNTSGIIGNIDIQSAKNIEIFGEDQANNFADFIRTYHYISTSMVNPPDRYDDLSKTPLRSDEYFTLKQILDSNERMQKLSE